MSLAAKSVEKKTVTTFATLVLLLGGVISYFGLGKLEDPEFTVKNAVVVTSYPGARPAEVELEVTDVLEIAIQEMPQLKRLESFSRSGLSLINVEILASYGSDELPQIWDELRKKLRDVSAQLPPGCGTPNVNDDFGDVFGFLLAVVGDGYTYAELKREVDALKKELSLVPGVARVDTWGEQQEVIFIDVSEARLATLELTMESVASTLRQQNVVVDGGSVDIQEERLRVETTGEFRQPEDIADLVIHDRQPQTGLLNQADGRGELIRIRDVGEVRRGYLEPTNWEMRYDALPAMSVYASTVAGANAVDIGLAMDARLAELETELPIGIEMHKISWQSDLVQESIDTFMVNLMQAVVIVLIVLWIFLGLRTAMVVGLCGLVFTILISFVLMSLMGIDLQRMSLGALVIAMGMMVDNAIVVVDGMVVRLQRGMDRTEAAIEAASQPSIPLLGATIVAVMAFYPIFASDDSAGEYCATLFSVVAISLMVSWLLAVTITPVMCIWLLPEPKPGAGDEYGGRLFTGFRAILARAMRMRPLVMLALLVLLIAAAAGFGGVPRMFFPAAARAQFMVDYWAPEGTRIEQTSAELRPIEKRLLDDPRVTGISSFIGQGPPRFYLPVDPEAAYASYGQLIVNVADFRDVPALLEETQTWANETIGQGEVITRKYGLGPFETWPVEARFSGPAIADPEILRDLADQAVAILKDSPHAVLVNTNWRQKTKKVVLDFDENNARWTGVNRADIADSTRRAHDGLTVGLYREKDELIPIMIRHVNAERRAFASSIPELQVRPPLGRESIPLSQLTNAIDMEYEDPMIWRWDRRRAITAQAVPVFLASVLRADVIDEIEAIERPPGYTLEWEGEFRSSADAQASLIPGMVPAGVIIALIVVALFNAYRPPLIILLVVPFAAIGITLGLLTTRQPFGFVALLGAMSLAGMMIKNAIVLLDQINIEKAAGKSDYAAVMDSAVSRLRPVLLAAGTTVLGVIPLLKDVFWVAMAVVIMFGLTFGAILTMIAVPVLYGMLYRIKERP